MDSMKMGTPWLDKPLSETYRDFTCQFNDTALCEYESGYWRFWYEADHRYALPTIAFFLATILVFAIASIFNQFASTSIHHNAYIRQATAYSRFLSYKTFRISSLNWNSAPIGILALGAIGAIYFFCMTLAPRPYYWPNTETINFGSSPPIATRSGWLSLACMPFVFATAGKSNFVTAVTGVSHEKLQVFHRWISYAFLVTALIHTFPFIVYNIKTGTMKESWDTLVFYWTGVVALIAQAWLTFASFGPLRTLCYEWFKFSHFVAALVFVLFLFFHCDHTLSSWDYFIATGVLFSLSWLHRQIRIYFQHGISHRASVSIASNGFICARIPTQASWTVGQHFFIRFMSLGLHACTIHPFTACSLPTRTSYLAKTDSELVLYIRPRGGFTSRLARHAEAHPNSPIRVLLDGPYGGVDMQRLVTGQRQLIVAGGSGAGWLLPMISAFLRRQELSGPDVVPSSAKVVLATRDLATCSWFEETVRELLASEEGKLPANLEVEVYYTGSEAAVETGQLLHSTEKPEKAENVQRTLERGDSGSDSSDSRPMDISGIKHFQARPDLRAMIRAEATSSSLTDELGVFVCGPLSMQSDVSNAVAQEQLPVMKNGAKSIYLHMEHFSWA
ncbi:uncharacterized protein MYCFIDRAFT_50576 [Pseudocercospora fijiensis CIRAD86]|uniref:FAD-binding FR-type domain-containing protein n=1 Tax=Pseudocercospora fijiensis (strain CIRAD86) TaxID=383855 RepID=M3AL43_PSEFD|nr:uncharacterized protein MYCFIDRAFT_50576 [Pseudocercospora fijiensis CIRAD86]EME77873.1 hypothetical protein MYCFIDRAFT_50576 [Pseudocercospora fijiensis CIRAD86]